MRRSYYSTLVSQQGTVRQRLDDDTVGMTISEQLFHT